MSFEERLNVIFTLLHCSNAEVAKASGIDASLISRFRNAARIPRANSSQLIKLCGGIVSYAQENFLWEELKEVCKIIDTDKPEDEIHKYLMPRGSKTIIKQPVHKPKPNTYPIFGEKLNILMNMLDISNIRLAKALNVDSSLISRFRNGLRIPPKNSQLIMNICTYLYKRVLVGGFEDKLSDLISISKTMVVNDDNKLLTYFVDWMSDKTYAQNTRAMDSLLEKLDTFTISKHKLPSINTIASTDILNENTTDYIGLEGFRNAVIRFLGSVAISKQTCNLKLYSDQNMEWLVTDPVFMQKWTALMYAVALKNPIQIIHNIDRNLPEMLVAIEKWLPLYMTGMIEAFYCKKAGDGRFANTFFIASQLAAINASLVAGTESRGKYHYINTAESILYCESQFDALMEMSKPLVQVFNEHSLTEYHFRMTEMSKQEGKTKKLLSSNSIDTMPRSLLEKILIRNKIDQRTKDNIIAFHNTRIKQFEKELQSGSVIEYVALHDKEVLFLGKVEINLSNLFLCQPIMYTAEEYFEHINYIIALLIENDSYNLVILPYSPFTNIQMTVKRDIGVMILKSDASSVAFWFGHPTMCQAFDEYLDVIGEKSKFPIGNKKDLVCMLRKYIIL